MRPLGSSKLSIAVQKLQLPQEKTPKGADISPASATNDFRRLLDAGLLTQHGRGPTTRYQASDSLRAQVTKAINEAVDQ